MIASLFYFLIVFTSGSATQVGPFATHIFCEQYRWDVHAKVQSAGGKTIKCWSDQQVTVCDPTLGSCPLLP